MTYILLIWTVVAAGAADRTPNIIKYDWRPLGEFHQDNWERKYDAKQMCENAARELGLKTENYRCIRSK
jgi:hypothetical protein